MKTAWVLIIGYALTSFTSCKTEEVFNSKGLYTRQSAAIRDYAFCKCIEYAFAQDSMSINDVSIPVILELSDYSISGDKRKLIDSLAKSYAISIEKLQVGDYGNKKDIFLKCLHFYRSKSLLATINKVTN